MSSWRDDPTLLRGNGPEAAAAPGSSLDPRWERLLSMLHQVARGMGAPDIAVRLGLSRGRAAALKDPEGSRTTLVGLIQLMVASLEIHPREIYGDPAPPKAVAADAPAEPPEGGPGAT